MTIGGNLKKLRVAQGLAGPAGREADVTRQAVSNWERNVSPPRPGPAGGHRGRPGGGGKSTLAVAGPPPPLPPSRKRGGG